jgi:hypothetical protein
MTPAFAASGVSAVSGTISSSAVSSTFPPAAGRVFHVYLGSSTGSGVCVLERQLAGAWYPITATAGGVTTTLYNWTYTGAAISEDVIEAQAGALYRFDCGGGSNGVFNSGSIPYGFSQ